MATVTKPMVLDETHRLTSDQSKNIADVISEGLSNIALGNNSYTKAETDNLLANKADTATTLAGYGITDAYTKTDTDAKFEALDYSDTAVSGSYVTEVDETDGVISVTRESADATPTDSSTKLVTSGGVKTALDAKADITSIAPNESGNATASQAYTTGQYFYKDGHFCEVIANIASGATLTENTNYTKKNVAEVLNTTNSNIDTIGTALGNLKYVMLRGKANEAGFINTGISTLSQFFCFIVMARGVTASTFYAVRRYASYTNFVSSDSNNITVDANGDLLLYSDGSLERFHIIYANND